MLAVRGGGDHILSTSCWWSGVVAEHILLTCCWWLGTAGDQNSLPSSWWLEAIGGHILSDSCCWYGTMVGNILLLSSESFRVSRGPRFVNLILVVGGSGGAHFVALMLVFCGRCGPKVFNLKLVVTPVGHILPTTCCLGGLGPPFVNLMLVVGRS